MATFIKEVTNNGQAVVYSDINIDYGSESSTTVYDQDALTQKILIVITVLLGSRKWRPEFGSTVYRLLHDPFDNLTAGWIGQSIKTALESGANGLTQDIKNVKVTVLADKETQTYYTSITWVATKLGIPNNTTFSIDPSLV
jgi:hypothetical protein